MAQQPRHFNYSLTPVKINAAKPDAKAYTLTDGGGLFLEVLPSGSKVWRYKYHRDGKREKVTIGPYPAVGLAAARTRHGELREQLYAGASPMREKQRAADERRLAEAAAVTFRSFAGTWIEDTLHHRSSSYRAQIVRWLDHHVYPAIGDRKLRDVLPRDVLAIIEPLKRTPTTADRVRVIIQQVYNYAIRRLLVDTNPATPVRGAIVVPPKTHHRHLSEPELGAFWRCLEAQGAHATTKLAARLLMLTMVRKSELRLAKWAEFDLDAAQWDIPAARMKMKRQHRVYLSRQAVENLHELHRLTGSGREGYILPSIFRESVPMAEVTLNHFFSRLDFGVSGFSPHGCRGTGATLLREHGFGRDVVELLLAHAERNQTVAAYTHAELAGERKRAMQFLADRIDELARLP